MGQPSEVRNVLALGPVASGSRHRCSCSLTARAALASQAFAFLTGCSLVVGDGTRVLAEGGDGLDASAEARAETEAAAHPASDTGVAGDSGVAGNDAPSHAGADATDETCSPRCADGASCTSDADCGSHRCMAGVCEPPGCASSPDKCADGTPCSVASDCGSDSCVAGQCSAPSCSPSCPPASACGADADCKSHHCTHALCM